jgi:hypothetical protein
MRYVSLMALLAILFVSCERDISPVQAERFVKFYGSYLMDEAGEVEVLDNGGYAICGTVNASGQGKRMALIVTDRYGNMLNDFPQYYNEEGLEAGATSLVLLQGGSDGFLLSGFVERPAGGSQNVQKDIFLVRTTRTGEVLWQRSYGSPEDEQVEHAVKMTGPGFMLAGSQEKSGRSNIFVMEVTEEGDSIPIGLNFPNPNAENATANFLLNTGRDYLCVCTFDKGFAEGTDILVLTFREDLSPLIRKLSGEWDEYGSCLVEEANNRYLLLGNRSNASGNSEMVVYALEKEGLVVTSSELVATIGGPNGDLIGKRMIRTPDGGYAIVGTQQSGTDTQMFLQFLSSGFSVGSPISYGSSGVQAGRDIDVGADGGMVMLGINSFETNSIISLIKTSETGDL